MRTAGLTMNNVWAHRVLREQRVRTTQLEKLPVDLTVLMETVEMKHRGPEEKYRPYLHLSGELVGVRFAQALPYEIDEITYTPGKGERVDAYYEFDDEQLAQLVQRGYFTRPFEVPAFLAESDFDLPATADVLMLDPDDDPESLPIVFVQAHDLGNIVLTRDDSGYDLVEFFEDYSTETALPEQGAETQYTEEIESLFTEEELGLDDLVPDSSRGTAEAVAQAHTAEVQVDEELSKVESELDAAERELQQSLSEREVVDELPIEPEKIVAEDEQRDEIDEELEVILSAEIGSHDPAPVHEEPSAAVETIDEPVTEAGADEELEPQDDPGFDAWAASAPSAPSPDPAPEADEPFEDALSRLEDEEEAPAPWETVTEADAGEFLDLDEEQDTEDFLDLEIPEQPEEPAAPEVVEPAEQIAEPSEESPEDEEESAEDERLARARALQRQQALRAKRNAARTAHTPTQRARDMERRVANLDRGEEDAEPTLTD